LVVANGGAGGHDGGTDEAVEFYAIGFSFREFTVIVIDDFWWAAARISNERWSRMVISPSAEIGTAAD
jgi:hypothetical protein